MLFEMLNKIGSVAQPGDCASCTPLTLQNRMKSFFMALAVLALAAVRPAEAT